MILKPSLFYFLIMNLFGLSIAAQELDTITKTDKRKNHYLIWTYHQKNVNTYGVSLGGGTIPLSDAPMNSNTNGIKIELIGLGIGLPLIPRSPISVDDMEYEKKMKIPVSERINGIVLSGAGTVCNCETNGFVVGLIGHVNRQINGVSAAFVGNLAEKHNGFQTSLFNESYYMNGVQFGLTNNGGTARGIQIGLYNETKKLKGIQIGLWNVNQKRKFPIINWSF